MHTPRLASPRLALALALGLATAGCASGGAGPTGAGAPRLAAGDAAGDAARAPRLVFLVRHAEKVLEPKLDDPPLTEAGRARAEELRRVLGAAGVRAIYATEWQRTQATARPLAEALRLAPIVLAAKDVEGLAARLARGAPGEVVVAVGHSNTLPELIARLGVTERVEIADDEYDGLWAVVYAGDMPPKLVRLRYGR